MDLETFAQYIPFLQFMGAAIGGYLGYKWVNNNKEANKKEKKK